MGEKHWRADRGRTAAAAIVMACAGLVAFDARAAGCSVAGKKGSALQQGDQRIEPPARIAQCSGVRVTAGTVTVCRGDPQRGPVCRDFASGQTIDAASVDTEGNDVVDNLMARLKGSLGSASAMSRGAEDVLPRGTLLLPSGRLAIDAAEAAAAGIERVEIRRGDVRGALLHTFAPGAAALPAAALGGAGEFWAVPSGASGALLAPARFRLATAAERADARRAFARIDAERGAGPLGRAVMRAAWLEAEHYGFDARAELRRAGIATPD